MKISHVQAQQLVKNQVQGVIDLLGGEGIETQRLSITPSTDRSQGHFATNMKAVPALLADAASPPVDLAVKHTGAGAEFFQHFHNRDCTNADSVTAVLENLYIFVQETSDLSALNAVEIEISGPQGRIFATSGARRLSWDAAKVGGLPLGAEIWTDDHVVEADIDAAPFMQAASVEDILALKKIGWRGDYEADAVYYDACERGDPGAERVEHHLATNPVTITGDKVGFEVAIDEDQAMAWLAENRLDVISALNDLEVSPEM